ncbi:Aste57867_7144 [Aphanomyces stellatus]|uniref:Aste57867_4098 protein n=1 Tax=Aphanomyces stellatus TaxID=120398 RepID=A0A485KGW3_9STRA|nr:hypothetical protein As57867_007120 [Aphanomyces stellatus]KAF0714013.1 hypothetical protein As57867_004087 [Aphanomyces stellatus]VFT81231.1 Aste57867_4098 [Aphanomyces stellatus]VFT84076.1 Aste57867_7144 [Aphanomyces stellatus]
MCFWLNISSSSNLQPLCLALVVTYIVCLGFHYELLLSPSMKDFLATKAMYIDAGGRPRTYGSLLRETYVSRILFGLVLVPYVCAWLLEGWYTELVVLVYSLGLILSAALEDIKMHLDDVDERVLEAMEAKREIERSGRGA